MYFRKTIPLDKAMYLSQKIIVELKDYCDKIVVSGAIRRECATVNCIEIVCKPKKIINSFQHSEEVKTTTESYLYSHLDKLEQENKINRIKSEENKQIFLLLSKDGDPCIMVNLSVVIFPAQFGVVLIMRTGPKNFLKWLVTIGKGRNCYFDQGQLFHEYMTGIGSNKRWLVEVIPTSSEEDVFRFLKIPYIKPKNRNNVF